VLLDFILARVMNDSYLVVIIEKSIKKIEANDIFNSLQFLRVYSSR
jgi:hypothetical protein